MNFDFCLFTKPIIKSLNKKSWLKNCLLSGKKHMDREKREGVGGGRGCQERARQGKWGGEEERLKGREVWSEYW